MPDKLTSSVFAFEEAGEGSAGDRFRVGGTQEMAEGAGANKVSGVLSEARCCRCGISNFTIEAGYGLSPDEAGYGLSPDRVRSCWTDKKRRPTFLADLLSFIQKTPLSY